MPEIASLYRYPVKGFSPEPLDAAELAVSRPIAGDRIYAIENGPSGFDPAAPALQPKVKFLCLMKNARLARLHTTFDHESGRWTIEGAGAPFTADLSTEAGQAATEALLSDFMAEERRGPLKVLSAPGHSFSDVGKPYVSFINLASVAALGELIGQPVDPLRFRANIYLDGLDPWADLDLVGRAARLGEAELVFVKRTRRCVATNVDPVTAERDLDIPGTLQRAFDHMDCGIYAEITRAGAVRPGDGLVFA
ncbi:MOSC domain-containing protein [Kaistia dalseonensis]|uniref:Uncharacterized protein YcbX n=1 Tax=Kaistia dalseonensis TaxID=410840 RepID=A0ABU0H258_9HYPH|nr:MOSC domain-containing protein [Kaistia dalseonensis]MCX5493821.1 MOSC domain-containing protein [Kaistia dalseonensis]MDQ0436386.1 uncharacterized protein YcbX [Kaistia dalseonensis]